MWQFRQEVLEAVDQNQVVIICGETGWLVIITLYWTYFVFKANFLL